MYIHKFHNLFQLYNIPTKILHYELLWSWKINNKNTPENSNQILIFPYFSFIFNWKIFPSVVCYSAIHYTVILEKKSAKLHQWNPMKIYIIHRSKWILWAMNIRIDFYLITNWDSRYCVFAHEIKSWYTFWGGLARTKKMLF